MNIARFKTLLAIARLGTFSDAANAVHRTPAAVSQQMKNLEDELGVSLFDRSKHPPELNPAGNALIPKARKLLDLYESIAATVQDDSKLEEELTIGPVPTTMTHLVPKALKVLQKQKPNLHVRVYPGLSNDLYTQVDRGFLDVALMTEPQKVHAHINWQAFAAEPLVVIAAHEIPINDPIELLETYPYIRFARRAWVGKSIDDWILDNNVRVRESIEIDNLEAVAIWAYHGLGVSIVPANCCLLDPGKPIKALVLPRSQPRVLGLLSRLDSTKTAHIDDLRQSLLQFVDAKDRIN